MPLSSDDVTKLTVTPSSKMGDNFHHLVFMGIYIRGL